MAKLNRDNQKGFTIVELVVVIIILGILAATALPRFIDVQDDAQLAVAEGVRGALMSAIGLAKAKYVAGGKISPIDMDEDGTDDLVVNSSGYPTDDGAGGGGWTNAREFSRALWVRKRPRSLQEHLLPLLGRMHWQRLMRALPLELSGMPWTPCNPSYL